MGSKENGVASITRSLPRTVTAYRISPCKAKSAKEVGYTEFAGIKNPTPEFKE
jgi:hypothetical protein